MKSILLTIAIIGAAMLAGCKNATESNNPTVIVVMDSQTPKMYQNADTLEFIKQSVIQNTYANPEIVEEVKMYFGTEGSRKSLFRKIEVALNSADIMLGRLTNTDMPYCDDTESLIEYCQKLTAVCDTLSTNQRRIFRVMNEIYYNKDNFYCEIKFKGCADWLIIGTITDNRCFNADGELWDLSKMNR